MDGLATSERSRSEEGASDHLYRLLIEGVTEYAVFFLDLTGHILTWNVGAERLKQFRADEIIGQHISRFFTPQDVKDGRPEWVLHQAKEHGQHREEGWRVKKDGTRYWADVVLTALRDETGRLQGYAHILRDGNDRKRLIDPCEERSRLASFTAAMAEILCRPATQRDMLRSCAELGVHLVGLQES